MADEKLQFSFELVDNVTEEAQKIVDSTEEANTSVEALGSASERTNASVRTLDTSLQANQLKLVTQMAALGSLGGAVNAISGGLQGLGLVGEETAQQLQKVTSAFNLIKGSAQSLVAVKGIIATLNAQEAINASLTTYLAALKNPAMLVGVGLAGGAAMALAGNYLMNNNTTNNTTNITVQDTTPVEAKSSIIKVAEAVGGGAL